MSVLVLELSMDLKEVELADLGTAAKVVVKKDSTTIVHGNGDKDEIANRVAEIKAQIEKSTSEYDKKRLNERLAKITSGVAIIKVGAATESEMKEKKLRIEDALNATKAAIAEGIIIDDIEFVENMKKRVEHALRDILQIGCKVRLLNAGTLPRSEGKAVRVEDRRRFE